MSRLSEQLRSLHQEILNTDQGARLRLRPKLERLIERVEEAGEDVPSEIRSLREELTDDAIEAQFDNMPV